jgi:hypothetical protein
MSKDSVKKNHEKAVGELYFEKPASYDLGVSLTKAFPPMKSALALSLQYGGTNWGSAGKRNWSLKYNKISLGAEYAIDDDEAILKKKALRLGYYSSSPSGSTQVWDWPDVQGITYGIGLAVGYDAVRFGLDVTQEYRIVENGSNYDESAFITSLALTYSF